MMRVALIGYGLIAEAHARALRLSPDAVPAVLVGPPLAARDRFAASNGFAEVKDDLCGIGPCADAAIVASPSALHYTQALACLEAGLHVLAEIPPAGTPQELDHLITRASQQDLVLQSTRTSACLPIYRRMGEIIAAGEIGDLVSAHYHRTVPPRENAKTWPDDALLHHAVHPLDLFQQWFGTAVPVACDVAATAGHVQELALLARLGAAPASIVISYGARLPVCDLTVVGTRHTLRASGFAHLHSDRTDLCWQAQGPDPLFEAVAQQDRAFLAACKGAGDDRHLQRLTDIYTVIFEARRLAGLPTEPSPPAHEVPAG